MKKIAFLLLLTALVSSACNGDLISYDFERSASFTIRAGAAPGSVHNFTLKDLNTDYSAIADANGQTVEATVDLYLRSCAMELVAPLSRDLNFLQSGEIYLNAPGNPEIKVAELTNTASNIGQFVEFVPTTEPVVSHFQADSYSLRLELVFDQLVTLDREVRILQSFRVLAEP